MKQLVILVFSFGILTSCEDVIEVDLNTSEPRLVVEASINLLENGTSFSNVKLTTTAPFFDGEIPFVTDAMVKITDQNGNVYPFLYTSEGIYNGDFIPQTNTNYTLEIRYNDEIYSATEQLYEVNPLEYVEQNDNGGFTGEDIELKAFFTDPVGEGDFYFFEALSSRGNELDVYDDVFFDGNTIFGLYLAEDLSPDDEVTFNLYGVNEQFYNFMFVLLQQTGSGGGPFETQPATVRGNIINETNSDNYPLGYFRISEKSTINYVVQ